jgi:uncharacterized protein
MASIGEINHLSIVRESDHGLYLDGEELGEILLPKGLVPIGVMPYSKLQVFIYRDSEDRLVATTEVPYLTVGKFAYLEVVDVDQRMGAFLDWGLQKDLLLPYREQTSQVRKGQGVIVTVYLDPSSERLVATERINRFLNLTPPQYAVNEPVDLIITDETELGFNAIVNQQHRGLLYHTELSEALDYGAKMKGYVAKVRPDGKIDLRRDLSGTQRQGSMAEQILSQLKDAGGFLPFNDNSEPAAIRATFDMSKKAFKLGIGALYRERKIVIAEDGIHLAQS